MDYSQALRHLIRTSEDVDHLAERIRDSASDDESLRKAGAIIDDIGPDVLYDRAQETGQQLSPSAGDANRQTIKDALRRLTYNPDGSKVDIVEFERRLTHIYGMVTTGHPVFGMNPEMADLFSRYVTLIAAGQEESEEAKALEKQIKSALKDPFTGPSLEDECDQSYTALQNAQSAAKETERLAIEVAREEYPDQWQDIDYMPMTVATWIPFDWDGRTDVEWHHLMRERINLQLMMLQDHVLPDMEALADKFPDDPELQDKILKIRTTITIMQEQYEFYRHHFDPAQVPDMMKRLEDTLEERITHPAELIETVNRLLEQAPDEKTRIALVHMRSRLKNHGIALAHPHFRINAGNVLSAVPGLEADNDDAACDARYLEIVKRLLRGDDISERDLKDLTEHADQIVKHMSFIRHSTDLIDSHGPNRYLIAEAHNATAILAVLYFANKHGVANKIDISPLFEDSMGVDNAVAIIEKLLQDPEFIAYLKNDREAQYRMGQWIAMQFGYSDFSRYDGTCQSGAYTDQAKCDLIAALKKAGLDDIAFIAFDTHGEGIGRGKHPASFIDRLKNITSDFFMAVAHHLGIKVKFEESFQGQDGYIYWNTPQNALSVVAKTLDHITQPFANTPSSTNDPYWGRLKGDAMRFYRAARTRHDNVSSSEGNALMIDVFKNMLPKTGSRPVKRPKASGGARKLPRAIQHNGTLQQMMFLSTVTTGMGAAIAENPKRFDKLMNQSPEFRRRMHMVYQVMDMSDPSIMASYIEIYNPDYWRGKGNASTDPERRALYEQIAQRVERLGYYQPMKEAFEAMQSDFEIIQKHRARLNRKDDPMKDAGYASKMARRQFNAKALHGARLASIGVMFETAEQLPQMQGRDDIIDQIFNFDRAAIDELPGQAMDESDPRLSRIRTANDNINRASQRVCDLWCAVG